MITQKTRKRLNLFSGCPKCRIAVYPDDKGKCPFCGKQLVDGKNE